MMVSKKYDKKGKSNHLRGFNATKFVGIVIIFCFSCLLYLVLLSRFQTIPEFISNKDLAIFFFLTSLLLNLCGFYSIFLVNQFSRKQRTILTIFGCLLLAVMFLYDQRKPDEGTKGFHIGYYASRFYIFLFFLLGIVLYILYNFVLLLYEKLSQWPRKWKLVLLVTCIVILMLVILSILDDFSRRREKYDRGLFGESFNPDLTNCRLSNDVFLFSRYLPMFFTHYILLSYWCTKETPFVEIIKTPDDSTRTRIRVMTDVIHKNEFCTVHLLPNIVDNFEYSELRRNHYSLSYQTYLQKNFLQKIEEVKIYKSREYEYDGIKYECSIVECGNRKNLIVNPRKKYDEDEMKKLTPETPNIILLMFDSESRKSFERDFPLSIHFIKTQLLDPNVMEFYQFYQHHVIGLNTRPQFTIFFNGECRPNMTSEHTIWDLAKQEGYLTIHSDDECNEVTSRYNHRKSPFMYTHLEPFCTLEYTNPKTPFSPTQGPTMVGRRCLFQHEGSEIIFEYFKKLELLYPETSKFVYAMFDEGHEASGESVRYIDRFFLEYLKFMKDQGMMEKSVIWLFSDHGNHMNGISNLFNEGKIGGYNPMLYLLSPTGYLSEVQKEKIRKNQHRIVTSYDLYKTWYNQLVIGENNNNNNKYGIDLLNQEVPYFRSGRESGVMHCSFIQCKEDSFECSKDKCSAWRLKRM